MADDADVITSGDTPSADAKTGRTGKAKAEKGRAPVGVWIGAGIGAGIGSAAIAAALLYATRDRKKPVDPEKKPRKT